jgi:hypothetical protein
MKAKKSVVLFVLTAFVFSIFANFAPVMAAGSSSSSISNVNKSITSGSNISETNQSLNAGGAVGAAGAAKESKPKQNIVKPEMKIVADTGEVKLCRARIGRLAVATMNFVKMAKINKKLYPRSAKDLVNSNHISKDEICCVHKSKGLFGESKHEYSFKLQQPYEKFIVIECSVHPENRMVVPIPSDLSKEELAKENEEKKECMIKMITAAGAVSRAVKVAVHDKKRYPCDIDELVEMNHLSKNAVLCPHDIKKLFGTKNEKFSLQLATNEKSYTFECPYHGNRINIKIPKYEDTLNVNEKEELAKEKEREEKLKQAVKDGLLFAAAAPLIPVALTVAGGVWAANAAYDAGKKAGAFVAEKSKEAAEAAVKAGEFVAEKGKEAGEAAVKKAGEALDAAKKAGEFVYDKGTAAGEAVVKTAQDTAKAAAEAGKKAGEAVVTTGKNAVEAAKKAGVAVVDTGKKAGEAVVQTGKKAVDAVVTTGKKAVDEAGKAITNAGIAAADSSINFLEGAQSFINGGLNKLKNGLSSWRSGLKK